MGQVFTTSKTKLSVVQEVKGHSVLVFSSHPHASGVESVKYMKHSNQ